MRAAGTVSEGLDQQKLDKLLEWLHPDRRRAAEEYENIRARLIKLFAWRGAQYPDQCVDETFDRVARRITEGAVVGTSEPIRYFAGVARNVLSEAQRRGRRSEFKEFVSPGSEGGKSDEKLIQCMERCLSQLPAAERQLMIDYHTGEWRLRLTQRERLVADLGVSPNALRLRCSRIRRKLDSWLEDCLKA